AKLCLKEYVLENRFKGTGFDIMGVAAMICLPIMVIWSLLK
ncbi:unnamed protein product, partial [marine sediment metagenome]